MRLGIKQSPGSANGLGIGPARAVEAVEVKTISVTKRTEIGGTNTNIGVVGSIKAVEGNTISGAKEAEW